MLRRLFVVVMNGTKDILEKVSNITEVRKVMFQELVLCLRSDRDKAVLCDDGEGLVFLHERLDDAAAKIKETVTSSRTNFVHLTGIWHPMQRGAGQWSRSSGIMDVPTRTDTMDRKSQSPL